MPTEEEADCLKYLLKTVIEMKKHLEVKTLWSKASFIAYIACPDSIRLFLFFSAWTTIEHSYWDRT
jgi:hypothetical protein